MRALPTLLTVGLLAIIGALAPTAEAATPRRVWDVPASAVITIKGHGYGHGHGMSAYGAEGAARQGLSYRQISEFYYPGTSWGVAKGPVTVLISADTSDDVVVLPRQGLVVRDAGAAAGSHRIALPDNGAKRWRLVAGRDGVVRAGYLTDSWHYFAALRGRGEFAAAGAPITLVTPSGERAYRGRIRLATTSSGDLVTVNRVNLESYLRGVVAMEMPPSWSAAAVRAQAVAARTFAAYERAHPRSIAYQICDSASCQVYGGVAGEYDGSDRAVHETRRQILTSGGEPALTQFASSSGGWTSSGSLPYLPAQKDPYDGWSGNPVHTWTVEVDDARIEAAWPTIGNLSRITVTSRDGNGSWGGRIGSLTLTGSAGRAVVSGDTFRSVLGLRSTWLTFKVGS